MDAPYLQAGTTREKANMHPLELNDGGIPEHPDYDGWLDWLACSDAETGERTYLNMWTKERTKFPPNRAMSQLSGRPMKGETLAEMIKANAPPGPAGVAANAFKPDMEALSKRKMPNI
jgi:hypothetical protein